MRGSARSRACGSSLELGLALEGGAISDLGLLTQACAIGQAAAAIFAGAARGSTREDIRLADRHLAAWLAGGPSAPDWPGIEALAEARAHPGRHGAIMLPWKAALDALPMPAPAR